MQIGIFAKTFDGSSPDGVLRQVQAAGFSVAQYNMACSGLSAMPDEVSDEHAKAIAEAIAATGVKVCALSATYNMIHPDIAERDRGHRRLAVLAKAAQGLEIPLLTLCTGTRDSADQWKHHPDNASAESWKDLLQSMEIAIGIADQFNVNLGIEPELANVVNSAAKAKQLIDHFQSSRLKIVFDPANLFETEAAGAQRLIVEQAAALLSDRITIAHAKDRNRDGSFTTAGKGVLDYDFFIRTLNEIGFNGPLVTHGLTAGEAPGVATFLKRALDD